MVRTWAKSLLVVLGLSLAGPAAVLGQTGQPKPPPPSTGPPQQPRVDPKREYYAKQRADQAKQKADQAKQKADQAAKNLKAKGFKSEADMWRQDRLKQKQKPPPPPPPKGKPPSQQKYKAT